LSDNCDRERGDRQTDRHTDGSDFIGLMEFAGVDKAARSKMGVWKMQEWTNQHDMARVDNAGGKNVSKLA